MFGFLKDKLKKVVDVFSKATTEETPVEQLPAQVTEKATEQPAPVAIPAVTEQTKVGEKEVEEKTPEPRATAAIAKPAPVETKKPEPKLEIKPTPELPKPVSPAAPTQTVSIKVQEAVETSPSKVVETTTPKEIVTPMVEAAPAPISEELVTKHTTVDHHKQTAAELLAEIETDFDEEDDEETLSVVLPSKPASIAPASVAIVKSVDAILADVTLPIARTPTIEKAVEAVKPVPQPAPNSQPKVTPQSTPAPKSPVKETERAPVLKVEQKEEKAGFFDRLKAAVTSKKITRDEFDDLFQEIEIDFLENNVALEVVDKIREDLWNGLSGERFSRFSPEKRVQQALQESLQELFLEPFDMIALAKAKPKGEPYVICAVGINGSGKTTTIGKLAQRFKDEGLLPVMAAGDTFRAAAIQQLEEHAKRVGVPIVKQQYGADAAAVAFDAIAYAKAHGNRVVLIDTAGRLHSNTNLMEELRKVVRVAKPDATIFIGEATTGNDCVEQAVEFQKAVAIDGIVLSKVDVDERGGAALSISYVTRKPILYFGTGQRYEDLEAFEKEKVLKSLEF